jgi:hypothetical protein
LPLAHAQSPQLASTRQLYEQGRRWLFGLAVGSGGVYIQGPDGLQASGGVHVVPEIGYFVWPRISLSAQLREEIPFNAGGAWRVTSGLSLLGRGTLWLGDGPLNVKLSLFGGNGTYFHRVTGNCGTEGASCTAIRDAGDKIAGVGIGASYQLMERWALTGGIDLVGGAPNRMVHADLNLGLTARF